MSNLTMFDFDAAELGVIEVKDINAAKIVPAKCFMAFTP
jgi:hypothetical protein